MEPIKYITGIICIIALISITPSCKKKSNAALTPIDSTKTTPDYINATINGTAWNADSALCNYINFSNDSTRHNVSFQVNNTVNGVGTEMQLYIANYTGPNSYDIDPPQVSATYYVNTARHFATSGTISILSDSGSVMKGTFSFTADSINVTNGVIDVPY